MPVPNILPHKMLWRKIARIKACHSAYERMLIRRSAGNIKRSEILRYCRFSNRSKTKLSTAPKGTRQTIAGPVDGRVWLIAYFIQINTWMKNLSFVHLTVPTPDMNHSSLKKELPRKRQLLFVVQHQLQ